MAFDPHSVLQWLYEAGVTELVADTPARPLFQVVKTGVAVTDGPVPAPRVPAHPGTDWAALLNDMSTLGEFNTWLQEFRELSLCRTATQPVFGRGQGQQPVLMVIAEAPDATEDQNGHAFSGPAHNLIQQAVSFLPLPPNQVYVTYLSKWRPPGQRSLSVPEFELAQAVLDRELALVQPHALIALGDAVPRALARIGTGMIVRPDSDSAKPSGRGRAAHDKIYDIDFKWKNEKISALSLQKPESMLKDHLTKKRVWQNLLSFCQALPTAHR